MTDITAYTDYVDTLNAIFTDEEEEDAEETEKDYPIYSEAEFLEEVYMSRDEYERMVGILKAKKNIILQGAPGVGKTYIARRLAFLYDGKERC